MSKRHLFNSADGLVVKGLRGLVSYNPSLKVIEDTRVVYDSTHSSSKVSVISGGGAGHEPAWPGYVGHNGLAASVSGEIFAAPSTKQVLSAINAVPSDRGTILIVGNYTGDCLHFGLACEKANAENKAPCGIVICGDDVSVGRKGSLVGRRGLAGHIGIIKIMGAAAEAGGSFDDLMKLCHALQKQVVSIASTLDHCHVPGRTEHAMLESDEIELGTGPHNEPGFRKISPVPSPEEFIAMNLQYCLDETDPERGYVHFDKNDEVALLISNFGGMSEMEMCALVDELLQQLETKYSMHPVRVYQGSIETSLNAPAFSTSFINLTAAARDCSYPVPKILEFLDTRSSTRWESFAGAQKGAYNRSEQFVGGKAPQEKRTVDASKDLKVPATLLESMIRTACNNLISAEPNLTRWDTVLGDGDCGETLKTGATFLLAALDSGLAKDGSVIQILHELEDIVESKMGGTLGGILGIFFVALTTGLQRNIASHGGPQLWAKALHSALENLQRYTPAKVGDRTVMDTLIPFADALDKSKSFEQAVSEAHKAAEGTKSLKPRLGRATYVGGMEGKELPPDPGAWGAYEVINGLSEGMKK